MKQFGLQDRLFMSAETTTTGHEYFSLADAGQYEEEIIEGYRGDLDANAALPPLPHDVYSVRVTYAEKWPDGEVLAADPARRWRKKIASDGQPYYGTWIMTRTENNARPEDDGRERTEFLMTYATKRGITGTQALLQGLGVDTVMLNSHQSQMKAIDERIAGEGAFAGQELDWEATVFDKEAVQKDKQGNPVKDGDGNDKKGVELFRLRGMKKFPQDSEGTYIPELCEKDGHTYKAPDGSIVPVKEARARNFARRWVPISKLTGGQQQTQPQPASATPAPVPVNNGPVAQQRPQQQAPQQPQQPQRPAAPARPAAPRRVTA